MQQGQCAAACAEEEKAGAEGELAVGVAGIAGFEYPCAVGFAFDVVDVAVELGFDAFSRRYCTIWRVRLPKSTSVPSAE